VYGLATPCLSREQGNKHGNGGMKKKFKGQLFDANLLLTKEDILVS